MFGRVLPALNPASGVCRAIYVGMFHEVDEGTAIFKVSNTPPEQGYYATYEGLPVIVSAPHCRRLKSYQRRTPEQP